MIPMTPISFEKAYCRQLMKCLHAGDESTDSKGRRILRQQHAYFEWEGFALLRGMELNPRAIVAEALWMLSGLTNTTSLELLGCDYAGARVPADGSNECATGAQFHIFGSTTGATDGYDQLREVCRMIVEDPGSRRIIINTWGTSDTAGMVLPTCNEMYQFSVVHGVVHMHVTQRSAEAFHVAPQGFALLSVIHQLICLFCRRPAGRIHYTCNDLHLHLINDVAAMQYARGVSSKDLFDHYSPASYVSWNGIVDEWVEMCTKVHSDNKTPDIDAMLDLFCKHHVAGGNVFGFSGYKPMVRLLRPLDER